MATPYPTPKPTSPTVCISNTPCINDASCCGHSCFYNVCYPMEQTTFDKLIVPNYTYLFPVFYMFFFCFLTICMRTCSLIHRNRKPVEKPNITALSTNVLPFDEARGIKQINFNVNPDHSYVTPESASYICCTAIFLTIVTGGTSALFMICVPFNVTCEPLTYPFSLLLIVVCSLVCSQGITLDPALELLNICEPKDVLNYIISLRILNNFEVEAYHYYTQVYTYSDGKTSSEQRRRVTKHWVTRWVLADNETKVMGVSELMTFLNTEYNSLKLIKLTVIVDTGFRYNGLTNEEYNLLYTGVKRSFIGLDQIVDVWSYTSKIPPRIFNVGSPKLRDLQLQDKSSQIVEVTVNISCEINESHCRSMLIHFATQ